MARKWRSATEAGRLALPVPYEGVRPRLAAAPTSPPGKPPLMRLAALQSIVCDEVPETSGSPVPHWRRRFRFAFAVFLPSPSPATFTPRVHPLVRFASPPESLEPHPPAALLASGNLPWGPIAPSRQQHAES